ncbi:MAG TPA: S8 family peptidase [Mobilitalea sp.]|nr:S8 family peptidase [Mobilitalea sp.]
MTGEDKNHIISEDYADLLFDYVDPQAIKQQFEDVYIQPINFLLSVVHVPVRYITNNTIMELGYAAMPSCFGLVSQSSLEASGINKLRNIPHFNLRGQGVLIGIIDTGIDYTNPVFRNADGTTRITALWDQTIVSNNAPEGLFYGTEYTKDQINLALQNANPLSIVPSTDTIGHGTMVAGIAAGNEDPKNNFYGIATDAEFVIVKLKPAKKYLRDFFLIPENAVCYQENDIIYAIEYLLHVFNRLNKPMSICIAIDTSQGAHDGRSHLSSFVSLIASIEGIGVTVSAGNEGNTRRHYYAKTDKTTRLNTVELNVGENEAGFSMELWGQRPSIFSVEIQSPSGETISRIPAGKDLTRDITFVFEPTIIHLDYQMVESQSGDQLILFRFDKPVPGIWRINVYEYGDLNLGFHIWLPMEGFISDNTYFVRSDPYTTVLALGNTVVPIAVTAYNHVDDSLYISASKGFNRLNEVTPDIAAPGVDVIGPTPNKTFIQFTGTSVSAAHTSGVAALLLEWGIVRGNLSSMSTVEMKKLIIRGARRDVDKEYPNRDWGYGILDIYNVFDSLRSGLVV